MQGNTFIFSVLHRPGIYQKVHDQFGDFFFMNPCRQLKHVQQTDTVPAGRMDREKGRFIQHDLFNFRHFGHQGIQVFHLQAHSIQFR